MFSLSSVPLILFSLFIVYYHLLFGLNFKLTYSQFIFDFFIKLTLNEPLPSTYYLFWVNLNYLPSFFFLFSWFILLLLIKNKENCIILFISLLLLIYLVELGDFLMFNTHGNYTEVTSHFFNNLLTNELNKYHPPIFYTSVIFFTYFTYQTLLRSIVTNTFNISYVLQTTSFMWLKIIGVNLLALALGSWWALQEGTWGGWWNWDPSETLGLLVTLSTLLILHYPMYLGLLLKLKHLQQLTWYLFALTYFFIQLNFEIVSHNFNFKPFFFFNSNTFLIQMVTIISLITILKPMLLKQHFKYLLNSYNLLFNKILPINWFENYGFLTTLSLFYLVVVLSLMPTLNYFIWNFFKFSVVYQYHQIFFCIWLIYLIVFSRFIKLIFVSGRPFCIFLLGYVNTVYFFSYLKGGRIFTLHFFLLVVIVINYVTTYSDFLIWIWGGLNTNFIGFPYGVGKMKYSLLVTNGGLIDQISFVENTYHKYINSWNVSGFTNHFEIGDFLLLLYHSNLFNLYYTSKDYFFTGILIELHNLNQLLLVSIFFFIYLYKNWGKKQIISKFTCPKFYFF